ncbi:hypothetical protein SLE2022_145550 [Rubroshorea leprosula]
MLATTLFARKWNHLSTIKPLFLFSKPSSDCIMYSTAAEPTSEPSIDKRGKAEYANINWDELRFSLTPTDYMYVMNCFKEENFSKGFLAPFGSIELSPSSGVLNYGQGLIEGLKAYRKENDQGILLFRPELNALRMKMGADRMCMPSPTIEQFVNAVKETVIANKRWIPPPGKGALYVRPLLMGTGPSLGVAPAPEYTFLAYSSPVGKYFKVPMNLLVEDNLFRAVPGGTGGIKSITNYSPIYKAMSKAKAKGFSDILFLDAATGKNIEEASASNIFLVKGNSIITPAANGTILPGITRKSIIEIAMNFGYQVEESPVSLEEMLGAEEVFCTGTAMVVNSVASITYRDKRMEYKTGEETVAEKLYAMLTGVQTGRIEDKMGWTVEINT